MLINRKLLIIWHKPIDNVYYYKLVNGFYANYNVGFKNSYGHEIILIIPVDFEIKKPTLKKRLIKRLISFLEKKL